MGVGFAFGFDLSLDDKLLKLEFNCRLLMLQIPVKIINSRLSSPNHVLTCSVLQGCSAAKKALVRARIVQWTMSTANNVR